MPVSSILCPIQELNLEHTVMSGQAFRWRQDRHGWWSCLLANTGAGPLDPPYVLVRAWQDRQSLWYETYPKAMGLALIKDYFRLDVELCGLTSGFGDADPFIRPALAEFAGLRVLRQDPEECLFSFLCTPAAPLHRIRHGISALCRAYGDPFAGGPVSGVMHYAFPPVSRLAEASLAQLTRTGLGFRAKYIKEAARQIAVNGGARWLAGLRSLPYSEAKAALMTLPGVGEKIADCVCLFALDKDEAVPVDTHIRQIACQRYFNIRGATSTALTSQKYGQIADEIRSRFGPMAGWAQQYLFFADLYERGAWTTFADQHRAE